MSHIQIRITEEDKKNAQETLSKMGLSLSAGIKLFLKRVVEDQALPFDVTARADSVPRPKPSGVFTSPIPAPEPTRIPSNSELPAPEVRTLNPFEKREIKG